LKLPSGIEQLNIQDGRIYARVATGTADKGLALSAAGIDAPFTPVDEVTLKAIPFHMTFPLDAATLIERAAPLWPNAVADPHQICEAQLNTLPDWVLDNSQTVQLQLLDRTLPVELGLGAKLTLPPHPQPFEFRTVIGIHRGTADLCLDITSSKTGKTQRITVHFDPGKMGGRARSGYQDVSIPLPPMDHKTTLALAVVYTGYRQTEEDNNSFIFLANPEVMARNSAPQPVSGQHIVGRAVVDADWYEARMPRPVLPDDAPVEIIYGSQRLTLFSPQDIKIEIAQDYGHSLMMTASTADRYAFFLDGKAAFVSHIGATPTVVRIPTEFLTGERHHLTVRDVSGMQVFLETFILLPRILTPEDVLLRESKAPYPGALSAQAGHRYDGLKAHMAAGAAPADLAQIALALGVLEGGYDNVKLKPLHFAKVAKPDVSIVIPAHNKVHITYTALCALLLARNTATFEVIVVDDASSDETTTLEQLVSGITVIHNEDAQRFIRACNAGAAKARGKYVVLLNNDTEPTTGWLDALIDAFTRFPAVGLVGSKLLYPNGRLQDAGGIIWGTGNPWNYGNQQNPYDPRFTYARQADYLSGAALMTTKKIWDEVGGLSSYLEPMYFEDTDFAFKVRDAGYTTWFVPSSIVYHYEGMTSGTDVSSGFKRYQEVNRPKFKRRWSKAYANFGTEGNQPDLEKDRGIIGRVLFIDYTTPRPNIDAGSYAAIQEIKLVQSLGYKVTFLPQNIAHLGSYTDALEKDGVEVITAPFYLSINDFLQARAAEFDAVYVTRYYVGQEVIDKIRKEAPKAKIIFNNADLHFLRELRAGLAHDDAERVARSRAVRDEELSVMRKTDVVLSYNEIEHSVIQSHTEGAVKVLTCPWVVESPESVPPLAERRGLSFLGSFKHHPNVEGITWFLREVMPLLNVSHPDLVLSIYGSGMPDEIRALKSDTVDPVGFVEDVADAYDRHRVFVAPLLSGAGIKGKVLAALAHGVPCVLTRVAAEGVGLRHGHDCMIAQTAAETVAAVSTLLKDDALCQALSDNARAYVRDQFSFARGRDRMRAAFEAVDLYGSVD